MGILAHWPCGLSAKSVAVSLYKVGVVYYVDLPSRRGRLRRSTGTSDKQQAQEFHEKLKSELWRQERLDEKPPITWGEASKKWLAVKQRGMPELYTLRALGLAPELPLPLSTSILERALPSTAAGSWNRALSMVVSIHNCSGVAPPAVKRKPNPPGRTRWLTAEEWARLYKALKRESPLLARCAEFAINTGLRENNVLNLEWSHVDMKRRVAWIHGDQAKSGQPIGVPLNDAARAVLEARRGAHKIYCFANPETGRPYYKASNRAWYEALRKAKLYKKGIVWHSLRHTWASWHVMNGTRLEELMVLGGWKSYSMVRRYAHLSTEHLSKVAGNVKPISLKNPASL